MGDFWIKRLEHYDAPMPGRTLMELVEDHRVLIEHHRGVIQYSTNAICIRTDFGTILVSGEDLMLGRMTAQQLTIIGKIQSVKLERTEVG